MAVKSIQAVTRSLSALGYLLWQAVREDMTRVWEEGRLFLGTALVVLGLLSFEARRFCDGISSGVGCTRPSTYYEYPLWATVLVVVGSFLVLLWWLYRAK